MVLIGAIQKQHVLVFFFMIRGEFFSRKFCNLGIKINKKDKWEAPTKELILMPNKGCKELLIEGDSSTSKGIEQRLIVLV